MSEMGKISDGYHTFDELYEHRNLLFLNLMRCNSASAWVSRMHSDGSVIDGWFIAGIELPTGQISYHLPAELWEVACQYSGTIHDRAPWDGHTSNNVLERLRELLWYRSYRGAYEGPR